MAYIEGKYEGIANTAKTSIHELNLMTKFFIQRCDKEPDEYYDNGILSEELMTKNTVQQLRQIAESLKQQLAIKKDHKFRDAKYVTRYYLEQAQDIGENILNDAEEF